MKIIKATDPVQINGVRVLLYGQPCTGKTSLAFTTKNPFLFDFDLGVGRCLKHVKGESGTLTDWFDFEQNLTSPYIANFDTIIIDTVGGMYQFAENTVTKPKKGFAEWGDINKKVFGTLSKLQLMGKNVVFIAHRKQESDGEKRFIPDIGGQFAGRLTAQCDLIGYLDYDGDASKLSVNFGMSREFMAKDCASIGKLLLPNYIDEPLFLQNIIDKTKAQIQGAGAVYGLLKTFSELCENADNAQTLNDAVAIFVGYGLQSEAEKAPFRNLITTAATRLNLLFDKETKQYVTN